MTSLAWLFSLYMDGWRHSVYVREGTAGLHVMSPRSLTRRNQLEHGRMPSSPIPFPKGPSAQYLRLLVPNTIEGTVFETRSLTCWVPGPLPWA